MGLGDLSRAPHWEHRGQYLHFWKQWPRGLSEGVECAVERLSAISIASCANALGSSVDFTDVYLSIRNGDGSEVAKSLLVVTADAGYSSSTNSSGAGKVLQFAFAEEVSLQAGFTLHVVDSAGTPVDFVLAVTNAAGAGTSGVTVVQGTSEKTDWAPYVGYGTATITNIPEPTALALLALGMAGVALRRRVA